MRVRRHVDIGPQSGGSVRLSKVDTVRVVDPEGQQVADLWAFALDDETIDWLSVSQTRDITERLFPKIGESFYSERAEPLLTLIEGNSPCPHDMLFPACNSGLYERAGYPNHPNCRDNLLTELQAAGVNMPFVPDPVNLFQSSEPQADGRLEVLASGNQPGGNVVLRAEKKLLLVVTACSIDYHPTNGDRCTGIRLELSAGAE